MIQTVELGNFLSHTETKLELDAGVTVFVGHNGSGKSSIIDAITFALFGKHQRKSNRDLIKKGDTQGFARVEITIKGKEYKAERKIDSRGKLDAQFSKKMSGKWAQIAAGERRQMGESMTEEIEKVIGLDFKKLKVSSIVQQDELNTIINAKPKEFKELLNAIIGIDRLDAASDAMKEAREGFNENIRQSLGYDYTQIGMLQKNTAQLKIECDESDPRHKELSKKRDLVNEQLQDIRKKVESEAPKLEKITQLAARKKELEVYAKDAIEKSWKEIERKEQIVTQCQSCFDDAGKKDEIEAEIEGSTKSLKDKQKEIQQLTSDKASLNEKMVQLDARRKELVAYVKDAIEKSWKEIERKEQIVTQCQSCFDDAGKKDEIEAEIEGSTKSLKDKQKEIQQLTSDKASLNEKLALAAKLQLKDKKCPVCNSEVEKLNPFFQEKHLRDEIKNADVQIAEIKEECTTYNKKLDELGKRLQRTNKADATLQAYSIKTMQQLLEIQDEVKIKKEGMPSPTSEDPAEMSRVDPHAKMIYDTIQTLQKEIDGFDEEIKPTAQKHPGWQLEKIDVQIAKIKDECREHNETLDKLGKRLQRTNKADATLQTHSIETMEQLLEIQNDVKSKKEGMPSPTSTNPAEMSRVDSHAKTIYDIIQTLQKEIEGFDETEYATLKESVTEKQGKISEIDQQLGVIDEKINKARQEIKKNTVAITELTLVKEYVKKLDLIQSNIFNRDGAVATSLRSWALDKISAKASGYLESLNTKIQRIKLAEKTRDISIMCHSKTETFAIESLSGGERVAVALALRLGMAKLLGVSDLNLMILDEPTMHLDAERKKALVGVLSQLSDVSKANNQMQFIIISHDSEIFDDSNVEQIYRFESSEQRGTTVNAL